MLRKLQLVMSDSGLSGFVWAGQASPVSCLLSQESRR